jgi:hypothetical protein
MGAIEDQDVAAQHHRGATRLVLGPPELCTVAARLDLRSMPAWLANLRSGRTQYGGTP